jgi:hypothetical protein
MSVSRTIQKIIFAILFFLPVTTWAHIIEITPISPFPSRVSVFSVPITATYLVTNVSAHANFTSIDKSEFPSGLSISSSTCGNVLTPGQTCTIQLTLNTLSPVSIATNLREWAKPTADGVQYPINVQVTTMDSGLLFAGAENGNVYVSANNGAGWAPTSVSPNNSNPVNCVFATNTTLYACSGNKLYYTANGSSWAATTSPDNSVINSLFITPSSTLVVGTTNGNVDFSTNNGASWQSATLPDGSAVDSVFISTSGTWYVGTANGNVYYSTNNGGVWNPLNGQPDGSAVTSIYVVGGTIYVGTADEYVYTSTALTGGGNWNTVFAQTVYRLFINSTGTVIDAGTQGGYVYSLLTGSELGFVTNSPINGLFQLS